MALKTSARFPVMTIHFALHTLLIATSVLMFVVMRWEKEDKTSQRERERERDLRDKQSETEIMRDVSTPQGGKAYRGVGSTALGSCCGVKMCHPARHTDVE